MRRQIEVVKVILHLLAAADMSIDQFLKEAEYEAPEPAKHRLLNEEEAKAYLGRISKPTFYELIREGKIKRVHITERSRRYDVLDLDRYIEENTHNLLI